jgi:phosphoenolpyruvate phosphomutase
VHSKGIAIDEIEIFMKKWKSKLPIVIVPTTYYKTPCEVFVKLKIALVIWANQLFRASIKSMQTIASEIHRLKSVESIDDQIVPLSEIFRLQNVSELEEAEKKYLR